nr:MAG TPA: hypothetical protein [Caudoviricetes sp.]
MAHRPDRPYPGAQPAPSPHAGRGGPDRGPDDRPRARRPRGGRGHGRRAGRPRASLRGASARLTGPATGPAYLRGWAGPLRAREGV